MKKGQTTYQRIIQQAQREASLCGLNGLTIGSLANRLSMSKSGLYAHFGSKTDLQQQVVEAMVADFAREVVIQALQQAPGRAQILQLMHNWINWSRAEERPGGCPMASSFFDLDALQPEVRQILKRSFQQLRSAMRDMIAAAEQVDLQAPPDRDTLVTALIGVYFSQHINHWLLQRPEARQEALAAAQQLLPQSD